MSNTINNNFSISTKSFDFSGLSVQRQLFNLNNLSTDELRLKWFELYKSNPANFKRGFLIKGIAYRIQSLSGCSNVSEDEIDLALKIAKEKMGFNTGANGGSSGLGALGNVLTRKVNLIPPPGSVIKSFYKGQEYFVKVLVDDKFDYNGKIYKSLSAIATEITGTRWNGYTFFKLKKTLKTKS